MELITDERLEPSTSCVVSIITPVYNGISVINDAISSVLAQDFTDWEWIIIDDGSTDGTAELLDALKDPRIRVVHRPHAGVSAARNVGLDLAIGKFVTFLDADDVLPISALGVRADLLTKVQDVDVVHGAVRVTQNGRETRFYTPSVVPSQLFARLARLEQGVFFGVNYMVRRDRIATHRFPVGVSHSEDLIFFLRLAHDACLRYRAVGGCVYEYRVQSNSAMSNMSGIEQGYLTFLSYAAALPRLDLRTSVHMQMRVAVIMIKTWLRGGKPLRALCVPFKIVVAVRSPRYS